VLAAAGATLAAGGPPAVGAAAGTAVRLTADPGRGALVPAAPWTASFDARLSGGGALEIDLGAGVRVRLQAAPGGRLAVHAGGRATTPEPAAGGAGGTHHVEVAGGRSPALSIDGHDVALPPRPATRLLLRGPAPVRDLLIDPRRTPEGLLLQRVAALHAATPPGRFPLGTGRDGRLRFERGWTSGFWPGALWDAAALAPAHGVFRRWALAATVANLGWERTPVHDVGFVYGRSSLVAYQRLCGRAGAPAICPRLRASVLAAADTLRSLAATNAAFGSVPTDARGPVAETIIDSLMNLQILPWASRQTGRPAYADLARRDAHLLAARMLRPDGAAIQSMLDRRADGAFLGYHRRQGLTAASPWARGQGWALAGFAGLGAELGDRGLVADAERVARFVAAHLPASGIPPWDYAAGPRARPDVSAGAITAFGLLRLAHACRTLAGSCRRPERWAPLGRRMLSAVLARTRRSPPLGFLGGQVLTLGGRTRWDDDAELVLGIDYTLQALAAAQR